MNSETGIRIKNTQVLPRAFRTPEIFQSAIFVTFFFAAIFLTVLGTLYSLSSNSVQAEQAYTILLFNLPLIAFLGVYILLRVWQALFSTQRALSIPLLHRRFVMIFSLAALLPAILVGGFSTTLISRNINDLFGENVRTNMNQAREFLNDYLSEQLQDLVRNVNAAKIALDDSESVLSHRITLTANIQKIARTRGMDVLYILTQDGDVLARVEGPRAPELKVPTLAAFEALEAPGKIAFQSQDEIDFLVGLTRLENYDDVYLYVGQFLKSQSPVLSSMNGIDKASQSLDKFNSDQFLFNKIFFLTFVETALLLLFAAIWLGFILANRILDPIGRLVEAAEDVREGNLSARVHVGGQWGEISDLGSAFNRMTRQLRSQRDELIREHDISEQRRQFSEAVLSGVRAGVIGLTQEGRISVVNDSAERLLDLTSRQLVGQPLDKILTEFTPAFQAARENITGTAEDQVNFQINTQTRNFDLHVSAYQGVRDDTGWVLTFDDMTRLVSAQRHSAWREVARRIAHEIKNPLTPIQLSAERLERKYKHEVKSDPAVFENCTQTIIRQVTSLEKMVDAFSAFAKRPVPVFENIVIKELLDQVLFAQGVAYPEISFPIDNNIGKESHVFCDERLVSQAIVNIYKNAAESIGRRHDADGNMALGGEIRTQLDKVGETIILSFTDNGIGWPQSDKDRLLEPYVTTREGGTGLGLAIVQRIAEDHGGDLLLCERPDGDIGARVQLYLPGELSAFQEHDSAMTANG